MLSNFYLCRSSRSYNYRPLDFRADAREAFPVEISNLSDSALLIDFAKESSKPEVLLRRALSCAEALERAKLPAVLEIASSYQSVALFLDEAKADISALTEQLSSVLLWSSTAEPRPHRTVEVPVCYDSDFALDAARVVSATGLSMERVIELHSSAEFTVACLGFMPGFPYLAGLPAELQLPRLSTPRTRLPAGSVAIANAQGGVYPFESPGGWNIIGRTPLRLFDPNNTPPALLTPGQRVRFRQITRAEFDAASANEK